MSSGGKSLLIELHFLPLVSYFSLIKECEHLVIEAHEKYQKQSLRNRTYILSANGELVLTVPVLHGATYIQDVKIDYSQSWVKNHLRGLTSAYRHAPYFEYYYPYLEEIYLSKPTYLFDLNLQIFQLEMKFLKLKTPISFTSQWQEKTDSQVKLDARSLYQYRDDFSTKPYMQVFGEGFIPNLSIIDLIFNCGPDSLQYL